MPASEAAPMLEATSNVPASSLCGNWPRPHPTDPRCSASHVSENDSGTGVAPRSVTSLPATAEPTRIYLPYTNLLALPVTERGHRYRAHRRIPAGGERPDERYEAFLLELIE